MYDTEKKRNKGERKERKKTDEGTYTFNTQHMINVHLSLSSLLLSSPGPLLFGKALAFGSLLLVGHAAPHHYHNPHCNHTNHIAEQPQ